VGLFAAQGYDQTTVADIAEAAGVSQMTFFRYFPAKERVILDDPYDPLIAGCVAAQPVGLPPLERVRRGLVEAWGAMSGAEDEALRLRVRIGGSHPQLRARMRENNAATEEAIAAALVADGVSPFDATVVTAAAIGALMAGLLEWAAGDGPASLGDCVLAALALLAHSPGASGGEE